MPMPVSQTFDARVSGPNATADENPAFGLGIFYALLTSISEDAMSSTRCS